MKTKKYAIQFIWKIKGTGFCPAEFEQRFKSFQQALANKYEFLSNTLLVSKNNSTNCIKTISEFKNLLTEYNDIVEIIDIKEATFISMYIEGDLKEIITNI